MLVGGLLGWMLGGVMRARMGRGYEVVGLIDDALWWCGASVAVGDHVDHLREGGHGG